MEILLKHGKLHCLTMGEWGIIVNNACWIISSRNWMFCVLSVFWANAISILHLFPVIWFVSCLCSNNLYFNYSTGICMITICFWFNTFHDDPFISATVSKSTVLRIFNNIWLMIYLEWIYPPKKFFPLRSFRNRSFEKCLFTLCKLRVLLL
jgi:hypothetical protein